MRQARQSSYTQPTVASEDNTAEEDALGELPPPASEEADVEVEREEDAPAAAELDPETRARRDAALRHVRKLGDPVLRATALPVERFDEALAQEVERMGELMHDALGVGTGGHPAGGAAPRARLSRRTPRTR